MQWTNYDPFIFTKAVSRIHVTLGPRGVFYLNAGAMRNLGEPVAVRLMFNKEEGLIGIAPVPLKAAACEIRRRLARTHFPLHTLLHGTRHPPRTHHNVPRPQDR